MNGKVVTQLKDAHWKHKLFLPEKNLGDARIGFGNRTMFKHCIDGGYMEWWNGEPAPRKKAWVKLTEKGATIVQHWIDMKYIYINDNGYTVGNPQGFGALLYPEGETSE